MKSIKFSFLCLICLGFSACTIHRIDVQQGNIIKPEQVAQLKPGINKRQVRFIMGSPLIQDPFHANRWDYIYTLQPGNVRHITERQQVTVFFENDILVRVEKKL